MSTNLIACNNGVLSITSTGRLSCTGQFITISSDQLGQKPALTPEQSDSLIQGSIVLFSVVFGFLCVKKLILN